MRARTWAIFILINVFVSAVVMLTILFVWEHINPPASPIPTPTLTLPDAEEVASPPTAPPVASPTPPGPLLYTVQEGDTLGVIAQTYRISIEDLMVANGLSDPNVLQVGQTLVIPVSPLPTPTAGPPASGESAAPSLEPSPTAALPTSLPTLTPSGPPLVEIGQVLGSGDLATEVVLMRNRGGAVSLEGWRLSDAEGNSFTFPAITLFANTQVRMHSAAGRSTPSDLYWGRATPAWNGGELITLHDQAGNVVDTYIVP